VRRTGSEEVIFVMEHAAGMGRKLTNAGCFPLGKSFVEELL
jgi:hypothetical protein